MLASLDAAAVPAPQAVQIPATRRWIRAADALVRDALLRDDESRGGTGSDAA